MKKCILFLFLLAGVNMLQAQTDVYNNGQLYITNFADTVFISGSLFNNSTAALNNAGGNLFVKQDLTNEENSMTTGGGKLWTTGTVTQNFYGSKAFKTHNWIVDNATGIVLQNRVQVGNGVGGNLNFVNGKINSGDSLQDVYFNTGSNYTGYTSAKHIIGYCSKSGATNFTFPIGNGTYKVDLDITGLSSSTVFQCKYFGVAYNKLTVALPLKSVFDKEYWTLSRTAGSSGAYITLKWNDARNPLNHAVPEALRVGHFTGIKWESEWGMGSGNTATGTVMSRMVNSYSPFTFASEFTVLPILMSSFEATATNDCSVNIKWSATEEGSVKKYILQKQVNNSWENIYETNSRQNELVSNYSFTDTKTTEKINMYRVATMHADGSFIYTAVKNATLNCIKSKVQVYPTITTNNTNVILPQDSKGSLFVYNNTGQVLIENMKLNSGSQPISLNKFGPGIYNFTIISNDSRSTFKVIKN